MLASCSICHREYVASKKSDGEKFVCSRCQIKLRPHQSTRLGLHPALERKWAHNRNGEQEVHTQVPAHTRLNNDLSNKQASLSDTNSLPRIPGFEIAYQIGRGAMGSVYRARQIKTGRLVAIKVLSHDLSERADLVARFEREAYALKSLSNPNVVSIIDAGSADTLHYFAMEFIDGITLRTRINRGPISVEEACFITSQILNGLKEAHLHGIIHRDLKPENVLLAYDGRDFLKQPSRVVLVDFGLVGIGGLAFDPHPNLTRSRVTMGTVNYMAPEQHVDAKRVDHRSDLYSAGVILFEMLTKELPLGRYMLPFERGMPVPEGIDKILSMSLSRALESRYPSVDDFQFDVQTLVAQLEAKVREDKAGATKPERLDFNFLKDKLFKGRYAFLLVIAGLFFALGIKFALATAMPEVAPREVIEVIQAKENIDEKPAELARRKKKKE